jgi:hypothetical protein
VGRFLAHRVHHQRIAFVTADRVSMPTRLEMRRMGRVHAEVADLMVGKVQNEDFIFSLEHLHAEFNGEDERYGLRPTLVVSIGISCPT